MNTQETSKTEVVCFLVLLVVVFSFLIWLGFFRVLYTEGVVRYVEYSSTSNKFTVAFEDGRSLQLRGVPNRSILQGYYYRISYNGFDYVLSVEEIEK